MGFIFALRIPDLIVYPSIDEMVMAIAQRDKVQYNLQELQRSTNLDSQHRCLQNILI